jgi:hypothetical protein
MSSSSSSSLSFRQSLALTALGASIVTSGVILSYQALRREHRTERLKREVGQDVEEWEKTRAGSGSATPDDKVGSPGQFEARQKEWGRGEFDESLIREQVCLVVGASWLALLHPCELRPRGVLFVYCSWG